MVNASESNGKSWIIKTHEVTKVFRTGDRVIEALKPFSTNIRKGEFLSIVGRSGSGKSTLLSILATVEKPTSGEVYYMGRPYSKMKQKEILDLRRNSISVIYQEFNLIPVLNAFQNIELPLLLHKLSKEEREERVMALLKLVGLEDRADHKPEELSGGERQRVAIARALAIKPSVILADEPTGDLDPEISSEIMDLLSTINKEYGTTLVMVTHNMNQAEFADRVIRMRFGEIIEERKGKRADDRDNIKSLTSDLF